MVSGDFLRSLNAEIWKRSLDAIFTDGGAFPAAGQREQAQAASGKQ
jgi:hypothetical protein